MQESTIISQSSAVDAQELEHAARKAERWFGEPFLHPGEEADVALAPGAARRRALDEAIEEIDGGRRAPSSDWKVRYGLMLGLERVLAADSPATASGTALRRHQIDALAGMLTELIAATQRNVDENGNGGSNGSTVELVDEQDDEEDEDLELDDEELDETALRRRGPRRLAPLPLPPPDRLGQDHRRGRLRRVGP